MEHHKNLRTVQLSLSDQFLETLILH